ncbi:MAG: thioredoxin domain-containing protein [Terriglobia bacterium]
MARRPHQSKTSRQPGYRRVPRAFLWGMALTLALAATGGYQGYAGAVLAGSEPRPANKPNRLLNQASPYLRGAAYQPVDWYPFGPEPFARAQKLDRPILLDIGAVWCHWCHVMDRESYENPEIARLINQMFVAVKVDRDARPDIDARYQRAVQALTGQGGWPLTAFLTPAGKLFFGGTYFPAETRQGRPGLKQLLPRVFEAYRTQKDRVLAVADQISQRLQAADTAFAQPGEVTPELRGKLVAALRENFDPEYGGPKRAPKFPHGAVIQLALERHFVTGDDRLREVAEKTLDGMARGGLRDFLHGGFYRYSTDRFWHVPHFEKMAYVQAELLAAFAQGYRATGKPLYREAAQEIIGYLTRTLSDQARGGFFASQDADVSLDDDGSYYTWTVKEIEDLLAAEEARAFAARFGVTAAPQRHPPSTPERNVLYPAQSIQQLSGDLGVTPAQAKALLDRAQGKLRAARHRQEAPFVDPTKFIDWNALVLSAYRQAYEAFGDESVKEFALRTTDFLLAKAYRPGQGMVHTLFEGRPRTPGLLKDQAYMTLALLDMFEISGRERYLDAARDLMNYTLENFWDAGQGGFFDVAHGEEFLEILRQPRKEIQDAPLPGANPVAALALDRLFYLTGEERFRKKAQATLAAFAGSAPRLGSFAASYARAANYHLSPPLRVIVVGEKRDARTQALWRAGLETYRPLKMVLLYDLAEKNPPPVPPELRKQVESLSRAEGPQTLVCAGARCAPPTTDQARLRELIRGFGLASVQAARRIE